MKGTLTTVIIDSLNRKVGSTAENAKYEIAWSNILESGNYKLHWKYMEADTAILNGLHFSIYEGYFNESVTYTETALLKTGLAGPNYGYNSNKSSLNGSIPPGGNAINSLTVLYTGRFLANVTGLWTFYTISDDGSYLWIGPNAVSGYTTFNSTVANGNQYPAVEAFGTINLVAGNYYPIRILYGESNGGEVCEVSFAGPAGIRITNGTGYYFQ